MTRFEVSGVTINLGAGMAMTFWMAASEKTTWKAEKVTTYTLSGVGRETPIGHFSASSLMLKL